MASDCTSGIHCLFTFVFFTKAAMHGVSVRARLRIFRGVLLAVLP